MTSSRPTHPDYLWREIDEPGVDPRINAAINEAVRRWREEREQDRKRKGATP